MRPEYDYGAEVRVIRNIRNDGTYPGEPVGALLVPRGATGFVCGLGTFLQDQIIYSVHFLASGRVVGCRAEELQPAEAPWWPSRFAFRDKVVARLPLGIAGRVVVEAGEVGEVLRVLQDATGGTPAFAYHVLFPGRNPLQVPETALEPVPAAP